MTRYRNMLYLAILIIGLIATAAGCGVRDSADHTGSQANLEAAATVLMTTPDGQPALLPDGTSVAWGQAIDATKAAYLYGHPNPTALFSITQPPTHDPVTMTALAIHGQATVNIKLPRPTPYSTAATPLAGKGTMYGRDISAFSSTTFLGENAWSYEIGDTAYYVYAGRQGHGPEHDQNFNQGLLVVRIYDIPSDTTRSTTFYKTPRSDGPARIINVQVQGQQMDLTVATEGGSQYRFNVNTGVFSPRP